MTMCSVANTAARDNRQDGITGRLLDGLAGVGCP
jgi:hypothetical protein